MTDIRFADVSEWQGNVDAPSYIGGGYKVIICRTHSGYKPDGCMPGRRDYFRGQPFTALGWYQYLAKDRDAATQANEFIKTIGTLKPNEFPILDVEEGSGSQTSRANAWFKVVDAWAGFQSTLYASMYFFRDQLGGVGSWGSRPLWMAAYSSNEPSDKHTFWQFTDAYPFPGIGKCDGNLYHGDAQAFLKAVRGSGYAPAPDPTPKPTTDPQSMVQLVGSDGRQLIFIEKSNGSVWFRDQGKENAGTWQAWKSLGTPGGK